MKRIFNLFTFFILSLASYAYDAQVDGIYYNLIPKAKVAEVTSGDVKYSGSVIIPEIVTSGGVKYQVTSIGVEAFRNCTGMTSVTIPNSVTSIGERAFYWCNRLKFVNIPNSVTSIGNYAFVQCSALTSITIPNSVTYIGDHAFTYCSSLTSIDLPNSVTSIGSGAFENCSALTSITIPNSVTSIGYNVFEDCSGLTSVTIPNSITSITYRLFYGCESLTSITIPNSVTSIDESAFARCYSLTSVDIPNSVTSIGEGAFGLCYNLTSVNFPASVTNIENWTFSQCTSLSSFTVPNTVTSIGKQAFANCSDLTTVTIGKSVRKVDAEAFANCANLETVYCRAENVPQTAANAFEGSYVKYSTLYVPDASLQAYKAYAPWNEFGTIKALRGGCATPTIAYDNGELVYNTETDGAQIVSEVKCADVKKSYENRVALSGTYEITAFAKKEGYDDSDTATATLHWLDAKLNNGDVITQLLAPKRGVLVSTSEGFVTITGLDDNEVIEAYTTDGKHIATTRAITNAATINANVGETIIIKIGDESLKVNVR